MSITSNIFIVFVILSVIAYYVVRPAKRWIVLLVASYAFYVYSSPGATIFLIASTAITFITAYKIGQINIEEEDRKAARKRSKGFLIAALILNLGILAVLKYTGFTVLNINNLFHAQITIPELLLPLGISYYTFQSTGYVLDVYWNRITCEKNPVKYALFVSFFPQIVQGPIGRFASLSEQLFNGNRFEIENIKAALVRIVWGLFKKMIIADWAGVFRTAIFNDPDKFAGIAIFGVLVYSAELYANFSGGIDIVIGVARLFGVKMDENFRQPFFSISISDFWQRWHITLGAWMKDYLFYPLSQSSWLKKTGKKARNIFGKKTGRLIPVAIANLIVFLIVGVWHGADWGNIGWGLYNGVIIAVSLLLAERYYKIKTALKINDESKGYRVFMILRTFALINLSWYFDCADSFTEAFKMIGYSVTRFEPAQFLMISSGSQGTAYTPYALITLAAGVVILFVVGLIREKKGDLSERIACINPILGFVLIFALFICIPLFSPVSAAQGFLYAQF